MTTRAGSAAAARQSVEALERGRGVIGQEVPAQYMVLVLRRDEGQQLELLGRFAAEGLDCKALLSQGTGGAKAWVAFVVGQDEAACPVGLALGGAVLAEAGVDGLADEVGQARRLGRGREGSGWSGPGGLLTGEEGDWECTPEHVRGQGKTGCLLDRHLRRD
jgi:hypothetical protein